MQQTKKKSSTEQERKKTVDSKIKRFTKFKPSLSTVLHMFRCLAGFQLQISDC